MKSTDVDRITGDLNPVLAARISAETWAELGTAITATDPTTDALQPDGGTPRGSSAVPVLPDRGRRRRVLLVAAMVALTAGVVGATTLETGKDTPRALSFTDSGRKIIVRVVDPHADARRYTRDFRAMGMKVKVEMVPVSPSRVGDFAGYEVPVNAPDGALALLEPGEKCNGTLNASDPGCQYGVEVDKSYQGRATIQFGRVAEPGEIYQVSPGDATVAGEELAGLKVRNRRVAEVRPLIAARGVSIGSYLLSGTSPQVDSRDSVPDDWYVHEVSSHGPGIVLVWVGRVPEK